MCFPTTAKGKYGEENDLDSQNENNCEEQGVLANHKQMREYVSALNRFYLKTSELWELDFSPSGFEWILADDSDKNLVVFRRKNIKGDNVLVILCFSGNDQNISIPIKALSGG